MLNRKTLLICATLVVVLSMTACMEEVRVGYGYKDVVNWNQTFYLLVAIYSFMYIASVAFGVKFGIEKRRLFDGVLLTIIFGPLGLLIVAVLPSREKKVIDYSNETA